MASTVLPPTRADVEAVGMKVDRLEMSLWEDQARRRRLRENLLGGAISALLGVLLADIFGFFNLEFLAIPVFIVVLVFAFYYYRRVVFEAPKDEPQNSTTVRLKEALDATMFFPTLFRLILVAYPVPEFKCTFPAEFAEGSGSITVRRQRGEKAIECVMDIDLVNAHASILYRHDNDRRKCEEQILNAQTPPNQGS